MSFHTAAYFASIANTGNVDVAALSGGILAISNGHFLPQEEMDLVYAYAQSANLTRVRINTPTNRQVTLPFIRPVTTGVVPPTDPNVADYRANPFRVYGGEELAVEASQGGAGAENCWVILGLMRGFTPAPRGNVYTMRGTSTTAAVANAWTQITVTWADNLPNFTYGVLGLTVISATGVAARLTFEDQYWRPGSISQGAEGSRNHDMFRMGRLGMWGQFRTTRLPTVEVLCTGADATHTCYLDFVRVA